MHMRLQLIPLLALMVGPSFAQESHFGAQVGVSLPQGELKQTDALGHKLGYTAGINLGLEWGGHVLRPRVDYAQFKRTGTRLASESFEFKVANLSLGTDYNYFVAGKADQGFYLLAGLGYTITKIESSSSRAYAYTDNSSQSEGAVALALGAGFQFTPRIGGEVRYNASRPAFMGETLKVEGLSVTVTFRF